MHEPLPHNSDSPAHFLAIHRHLYSSQSPAPRLEHPEHYQAGDSKPENHNANADTDHFGFRELQFVGFSARSGTWLRQINGDCGGCTVQAAFDVALFVKLSEVKAVI
jgi:hypothetical protein